MGRLTDLRTNEALNLYQSNPTIQNELNFLTWKKTQLEESGGFSWFKKGCCSCAGPSDESKCNIIKQQYPKVVARIEEINKLLAQGAQEQADIKEPEIILTNQETVQEQLEEKPQIQTTSNNNLRNVLLIGGALLFL